ncbi:hypothetical protein DL96DRAFT_1554451 [Flagelloscypha sp. PMI_526]|nr:hypothetical protein DL96DRAFT_1554451 [Flagelloscypha sp. PMI_526]
MLRGAFCQLFDQTNNTQFVLDGSTVNLLIADIHASVEISQRFTNPLDADVAATYTFGLMASVAVCSFKMIRADGTEIEGVVKEKEEANREYQEAVKQGYTAALGAEDTKDVFSIRVGNIPAKETVIIKLRYLQTLTDDEKRDQVRFMFPRAYAQRYGSAPTFNAASASTVHQRFSMNVIVQQASTIKSISCPSGHPMRLELGKPDGFAVDDSVPDSQLAKVVLTDRTGSLSEDILLVITAAGLDSPRCFVERNLSSTSGETVAMGLTFVPRFTLPDHPAGMEYIFVVDRSGSMTGPGINLVKEALVVLLRGLPSKGTQFNIVSFGSCCTKFWESSQAYTQSNLETATSHIDSMKADYGGTEIAYALDLVFSSLSTPLSKPVAVFLLTDGGAWDVAGCVAKTKNAMAQQATKENFLRVFTVGIGKGASTDTCDNIAKAGGAISVYVGPNEPVVGKCARLVRAARTPPIQDLQIFWTGEDPNTSSDDDDDFELVEGDTEAPVETTSSAAFGATAAPATISLFDGDTMDNQEVGPALIPAIRLSPPSTIQQAPIQPQSLFPGTRSQLYAIVAKKEARFPHTIKVRGTVTTTGAIVELDVPICTLSQSQESHFDFLHILAAKALISDRENQIHDFSPSIASSFKNNNELRDAYLKADIIRLGVKYGLSSRHTSFVAIDRRARQTEALVLVAVSPGPAAHHNPSSGDPAFLRPISTRVSNFLDADSSDVFDSMLERLSFSPADSSSFPDSSSSSSLPVLMLEHLKSLQTSDPEHWGEQRTRTRTRTSAPAPVIAPAAPPLPSVSGHAILSPPPPPPPPAPVMAQQEVVQNFSQSLATPSLSRWTTNSATTASSTASSGILTAMTNEDVAQMNKGARLAAVARLQQFDGRFKLSEGLLSLLGISLELEAIQSTCAEQGLEEDVVATVLARAWLFKNGEDESLAMQEKALEWLGDHVGDERAVGGLVEKIEQLISVA